MKNILEDFAYTLDLQIQFKITAKRLLNTHSVDVG